VTHGAAGGSPGPATLLVCVDRDPKPERVALVYIFVIEREGSRRAEAKDELVAREWGMCRLSTVTGGELTGMTSIAAGAHHSLALKSDGTVIAWGYLLGSWGLPPSLPVINTASP